MSYEKELTPDEQSALDDPWLTDTLELTGRSEGFKEAFRAKFGIKLPERSAFDVALDNRAEENPAARLKTSLNALMRSNEGRQELSERDPKWRKTYLDNIIEQTVLEFRRYVPDYFVSEWNANTLTDYLAKKYLGKDWLESDDAARELFEVDRWTVETLQEAYDACLAAGQLQVPKGNIKPLSKQQQLEVIAQAQMDGPAEAIVRYIELAMGELPDGNNAAAVTRFRANNPKVCNEGTLFVFRNLHGNSMSDSEFAEFEQMMLARSPLLTYQQLLDGYAEFRRASKPSALFPNGRPAVLEDDPNDLSDEELSQRILQARRAARSARSVL